MNKVILIGNLANDPEPFTTQSGISRSTFRLAVQRRFANAQGVREADFPHFDFYSSDARNTTYTILVEGVTAGGELVRGTHRVDKR